MKPLTSFDLISRSMFVGMDPMWTVEECQEALSACGANLCIVEDMYQFEKIYQVGLKLL